LNSEQTATKVAALLAQMTLAEKIGQLAQYSNNLATGASNVRVDQKELAAQGGLGSLFNLTGAQAVNDLQKQAVEKSRLKIPILFGLDVIHGYRTIYPIPLGLAAAWNPALAEQCARMAAVEATAQGVRWTFSPMIDIARDARWGRITEGSGEDTYLGSLLAAAWVRGYQGPDLTDPASMLACAKHFVAYGGAEGGRDYNTVDISERVLRDVYLPPFQAAVEAGAGTLMSAFNTLQGVPASANHHTLTDILRNEWGFDGFVVSDWNSVGELLEHGVALDGAQAARLALTAGVDMDMQANLYSQHLASLVESGQLDLSVIDTAVARVLGIKFDLGLFDSPYTDEALAASAPLADHVALARQAAEESFVLLKNDPVNDTPLLPLAANQKVALIGSLADSQKDMFGSWVLKGVPEDVATLRQSLAERLGDSLTYVKGVDPESNSEAGFDEALAAAQKADVVIMALGETFMMSGEAHSRANLDLPGVQLKLLQAVVATGKPVVLVLFSGRPLALPWEAANVPAILEAWFPGVQAGPALTRILYGDATPSGKLTATFPRSVGQVPLYYNTFSSGRPSPDPLKGGNPFTLGYLDEATAPLYPFGWGLSYTTFDYAPTHILTPTIAAADLNDTATIKVETTVTNSGTRAAAEVVQLYIRQRGASVARPVRELKGFQKITLAPGESRNVQFTLTKKELAFWNLALQFTVEPGELTLWIAPHAQAGHPAKVMLS
jgi:beta-glucosidase